MLIKPYDLPPHAKKVFEGEIFTVWQWKQKLYDNTTATFERITRVDAASIIGVLPDNKILMIRDEQPHRPALVTAPGGRLEPGEKPEEGAKRELLEETGYEAEKITNWFSYVVSHSVVFTCHFYIGKNLKKANGPKLDAGEKITLQTYTFDEFLNLCHEPSLQDTQLRVKLLEAQLDKNKKEELNTLLYA